MTYTTCTCLYISFFFFNDTPPTEIYTLSLHDALPICLASLIAEQSAQDFLPVEFAGPGFRDVTRLAESHPEIPVDRKSTRLNSSHVSISYAVFCLKKKKKSKQRRR